MSDIRCGTCRLWEPTRSSDTGRPFPSQPGDCGWKPPAWPALPASYHVPQWHMRKMAPDWPTKRVMYAHNGADCGMWEPKPKRAAQQGSLIEGETP